MFKSLVAIAILLMVLVTGCASLTPAGENVRITSNPDVVRGCKYIGRVEGNDHLNGGSMGQGAAEKNATIRLQNSAAEMGANTVFLARSSTGFSGSNQLGEAYSCSADPSTGLAAASTFCRWDMTLGDWASPDQHLCGSIAIVKASTKMADDVVKGTIYIENKSKKEVVVMVTISAMAGEDVVGTTTFRHDIGDSTVDSRRFAVAVAEPKTVTKVVVSIAH